MGEMRVLSVDGDTKTIWDPRKSAEVITAEEQFEKLTDKGYIAYTVNKKGKKSKIMKKFDPDAEKMILTPPIVGG